MNQQPPPNGWAPLPAPPQMPPMPYYGGPPPIGPTTTKPSGGYKALAIVEMALGALGILYALFTIAMTAIFKSWTATASLYDWPTFAYAIGHSCMAIVTGALLIATGIGIYKAKRWSRMVGIAYGCLSLAETVFGTAINLLVIQPGVYARMHTTPPPGVEMIGTVSALFGVLVMSILPVFTIIALARAGAKEQLDV